MLLALLRRLNASEIVCFLVATLNDTESLALHLGGRGHGLCLNLERVKFLKQHCSTCSNVVRLLEKRASVGKSHAFNLCWCAEPMPLVIALLPATPVTLPVQQPDMPASAETVLAAPAPA